MEIGKDSNAAPRLSEHVLLYEQYAMGMQKGKGALIPWCHLCIDLGVSCLCIVSLSL